MSLLLLGALLSPANWTRELEALERVGQYPRANLLVDAVELAKPEIAKQFLILDARGKQKYDAGHIPGAVWIDSIAWSRAPLTARDPEAWAKRIGALGIDQNTRVVIYDDNVSKDSARIWWILRYWGIADVRLLNGGWRAWQNAGGIVSRDEIKPSFRKPMLAPVASRLATKEQVLEGLAAKKSQIIDARSRAEYCGEEQSAKRGGAIPGAIHLEWLDVLDEKTQRFKSPQELSQLFATRGIHLDRLAVTYCQSGGRAAVMAFALELMGSNQVQNYYQSWAEWGNAADTPVEKPMN